MRNVRLDIRLWRQSCGGEGQNRGTSSLFQVKTICNPKHCYLGVTTIEHNGILLSIYSTCIGFKIKELLLRKTVTKKQKGIRKRMLPFDDGGAVPG